PDPRCDRIDARGYRHYQGCQVPEGTYGVRQYRSLESRPCPDVEAELASAARRKPLRAPISAAVVSDRNSVNPEYDRMKIFRSSIPISIPGSRVRLIFAPASLERLGAIAK